MVFKRILITIGLICALLIQTPILEVNAEVLTAPFKSVFAVDIASPSTILNVPRTAIKDTKTLNYLAKFLDNKIKTVSKNIESSLENGKTNLTSLNSAWDIANFLVGKPGTCFYIASLFVEMYQGKEHKIANAYEVSEPMLGDVIYYADGGLGIEHWAIYLGDNLALQGNYLGTTIIGPVYINNASEPIYYRVP